MRDEATNTTIQVNTDNHIQGDERLVEITHAMAVQHIGRFLPSLTRVIIHLADANSIKHGQCDIECTVEARPENQEPVVVRHKDENVERAVRGALTNMKARLETVFGRQRDRH